MKDNGLKERSTELEYITIKMGSNIGVGLPLGKNMVMVFFSSQMAPRLKAFGIIIILKDWLKFSIRMVTTIREIYI